tara:strand:+ start:82144 stop:83109 length:966 start_codon:yes stop_codon:yes gene_type:complete
MVDRMPFAAQRLSFYTRVMKRFALFIACVLIPTLPIACSQHRPIETAADHPLHDGPIHNLHQLKPGLYSGGEPPEASHYAQLAEMGIRTVVSVDAIPPNPELAAPYGIRIIHLPIGYDGISDERAVELAAAIDASEQPIYVHCHHGKHRGPAALCVGAIGAGLITNEQANDYMKVTGTSAHYTGLWKAASEAHPIDESTLRAVPELPSKAPVESFVRAMGSLDRLNDRIWEIAKNDWKTPEDHPDLTPEAISGRMHDLMRSMSETKYVKDAGPMMTYELDQSIDAARELEIAIESKQWPTAIDALTAFKQTCKSCHEQFRD